MNIIDKNPALYQSYSQLDRKQQVTVAWEILRAQAQIIFSKKFLWAVAVILIYFTVFYFVNYHQEIHDRWTQRDILWLLMWPICGLALFLNMQLISSEKENRTLEVLFTTAGSRHKVWLLRIGTLNLIFLVMALSMSALTFFTYTELSISGTGLNAFVPGFFIGSLTLYFSVRCRSGLAAGMLTGVFWLLMIMFYDALEETRYSLFFNPYDVPGEIGPETWNLWMWQNRLALLVLGAVLQFFALRNLENRERLLK